MKKNADLLRYSGTPDFLTKKDAECFLSKSPKFEKIGDAIIVSLGRPKARVRLDVVEVLFKEYVHLAQKQNQVSEEVANAIILLSNPSLIRQIAPIVPQQSLSKLFFWSSNLGLLDIVENFVDQVSPSDLERAFDGAVVEGRFSVVSFLLNYISDEELKRYSSGHLINAALMEHMDIVELLLPRSCLSCAVKKIQSMMQDNTGAGQDRAVAKAYNILLSLSTRKTLTEGISLPQKRSPAKKF